MNAKAKRINSAKLAETPKPKLAEIPTPPNVFIGGGAEKLYKLEEDRQEVIKRCIAEQARVMGYSEPQYWTHSVPAQLLSILEAWHRPAAARAAQSFLEQYGFTVTEPAAE